MTLLERIACILLLAAAWAVGFLGMVAVVEAER